MRQMQLMFKVIPVATENPLTAVKEAVAPNMKADMPVQADTLVDETPQPVKETWLLQAVKASCVSDQR
jgi:hypothetical protein